MNFDLPIPGPETIPAEQGFLGSLLLLHEPDKVLPLVALLGADDLYQPAHQTVLEACTDLAERDHPCDPMAVAHELIRRGELDRIGGAAYLHTLMATPMTAALGPQYAEQIRQTARRRRAVEHVTRAAQRLSEPTSDADATMMSLMDGVDGLMSDLAPKREREPAETIDAFLAREIGFDWLVTNLIERGDRMIVTGSEGAGKSTFVQQVCVCLAGGVHPFTGTPIPAINVLIIDCENGSRHLRRKLRELVDKLHRRGLNNLKLRVESRPSGLDLTRGEDSAWLMDLAVASKPDLIAIGPLYRLYAGAVKDEECARAVTVTLDAVRARVGCSLLMEAHSPHGEAGGKRPLRPSGSSLWMRWPEFGYGLRLRGSDAAVLEPWRGPRDERGWPEVLARGGPNRMPWVVKDLDYLAGQEEPEAAA